MSQGLYPHNLMTSLSSHLQMPSHWGVSTYEFCDGHTHEVHSSYYPDFTDEESQIQRKELICPNSYNFQMIRARI